MDEIAARMGRHITKSLGAKPFNVAGHIAAAEELDEEGDHVAARAAREEASKNRKVTASNTEPDKVQSIARRYRK